MVVAAGCQRSGSGVDVGRRLPRSRCLHSCCRGSQQRPSPFFNALLRARPARGPPPPGPTSLPGPHTRPCPCPSPWPLPPGAVPGRRAAGPRRGDQRRVHHLLPPPAPPARIHPQGKRRCAAAALTPAREQPRQGSRVDVRAGVTCALLFPRDLSCPPRCERVPFMQCAMCPRLPLLQVSLFYSANGAFLQREFFNETITIIEEPTWLDTQLIGLYIIGLAVLGAICEWWRAGWGGWVDKGGRRGRARLCAPQALASQAHARGKCCLQVRLCGCCAALVLERDACPRPLRMPRPPPAVYSAVEFAKGQGWIKKSKPVARPGAPPDLHLAYALLCCAVFQRYSCGARSAAFVWIFDGSATLIKATPPLTPSPQPPPPPTRTSGCAARRQTPSCARSSRGAAPAVAASQNSSSPAAATCQQLTDGRQGCGTRAAACARHPTPPHPTLLWPRPSMRRFSGCSACLRLDLRRACASPHSALERGRHRRPLLHTLLHTAFRSSTFFCCLACYLSRHFVTSRQCTGNKPTWPSTPLRGCGSCSSPLQPRWAEVSAGQYKLFDTLGWGTRMMAAKTSFPSLVQDAHPRLGRIWVIPTLLAAR